MLSKKEWIRIAFLNIFLCVINASILSASFSPLDDLDDSIISETREAVAHSYEYIDISRDIQKFEKRDGSSIFLFRGSSGHSNKLSGGRYEHNMGIISTYPEKNRIIIAFHGSTSIDDWVSNFSAVKENAPHGLQGKVHRGFHDIVQSSYGSLIEQIKKIFYGPSLIFQDPSQIEFVFTGHSLGGATSTLAAAQFRMAFSENFNGSVLNENQIKVMTYSAPCVGDRDFASHLSRVFKDNLIRFTSNFDPVPIVVPWGYQAGNEIRVLFLEHLNDKASSMKENFEQPGFHPKYEVLSEMVETAQSCVVATMTVSSPIGLLTSIGSLAKKSIPIAHEASDIDTLKRAFFYYQLRNSDCAEGEDLVDNSQTNPGEVSIFDPIRNPVIRNLLSFFGGY